MYKLNWREHKHIPNMQDKSTVSINLNEIRSVSLTSLHTHISWSK